MWRMSVGLIGALALCGCQTAPRDEMSTRESATVHPGDAVVSAVGTPFYVVFKGVVCVASVALAAPVAGFAALSDSRLVPEVQTTLGDGVSQNCGPPWVLQPARRVAVAEPSDLLPTPPAPEQPWIPAPAEPKPLFPE
jgi:hypothetical protein